MQDFKHELNTLLHDAHLSRSELADIFKITRRSVSCWNTVGIPQYARAYLKLRAEYIRLKREGITTISQQQ